jgi:hypothetical protein
MPVAGPGKCCRNTWNGPRLQTRRRRSWRWHPASSPASAEIPVGLRPVAGRSPAIAPRSFESLHCHSRQRRRLRCWATRSTRRRSGSRILLAIQRPFAPRAPASIPRDRVGARGALQSGRRHISSRGRRPRRRPVARCAPDARCRHLRPRRSTWQTNMAVRAVLGTGLDCPPAQEARDLGHISAYQRPRLKDRQRTHQGGLKSGSHADSCPHIGRALNHGSGYCRMFRLQR